MNKRVKRTFFIVLSLMCILSFNMQISYAGEAKKEKLDIKVMDNSFYTEENLFFDNSENAVEKLEVDNSFLDLTGSAVPSYYSSVDKGHTSSVKDQASYGTCWSFATVAAIESYLIKNNIAKSNIDLSETQLAYFTYNQPTYSYGNVHNDKMTNKTTTHYLNIGGNYYMSTLALAKGIGLASEKVMPYSQLGYTTKYDNNLAFESEYMLKNSYFINMGDQLAIKNAVMKYGSVACTMYYNGWNLNLNTNGYNQKVETSSNHAVVIVGWNDNYSANNFSTIPSKNGAWLVKNSYGTNYGDNGYFWVSYEETSIPYSLGAVFEADINDGKYLHRYQYDGTSIYAFASDVPYYSNVYTALSNEKISEVGLMTMENNLTYEIEIYTSVSNVPTSGRKVYSKTGNLELEGYHTIEVDDLITVRKGTKFAIVVKLRDANGGYVDSLIDMSYHDECVFDYDCEVNIGESYWGYNKYSWIDSCSSNEQFDSNWRIKVLTKGIEEDEIANETDKEIENNIGIILNTTVNYDYNNYKVVIKPNVTGAIGTKKYTYIIKNANNITVHEKEGVTADTYYWTPSVGGTYTVYCTIEDDYNNKTSYKKIIVPILTNAKMSVSTQFANNKMMMKVNASATNGAGVTQYCYTIKNAHGTTIANRCYTVQNVYEYQITASGTYNVYCTVKDSLGKTYQLAQRINVAGISSYNMYVSRKTVSNRPVISIGASSAGGFGTKQYYYRIKKSNGVVVAVRNYSTVANYDWYPTGGGTYIVEGYVIDALGSIKYNSTSCTVVSLSLNRISISKKNVSKGLRLQIRPISSGAIGGTTYYYQVKNSKGKVMKTKSYSTSTYLEWCPSKADTYYIVCNVKDGCGNIVSKQVAYKVTKSSVKIKKITYSKKKSGKKYKVTIKPSASGGYGTKNYQYQILNSKGKLMTKKNYTTATKVTLNVSKRGTYYIRVYAKDKWGTKASKKIKIKI